MKAKELAAELLKNPDCEVYYNSAIAQPDGNYPIGYIYQNNIPIYRFKNGDVLSYIPKWGYDEMITITDQISLVLTDKKR